MLYDTVDFNIGITLSCIILANQLQSCESLEAESFIPSCYRSKRDLKHEKDPVCGCSS